MARLAFAFRMAKDRWNEDRALCPYCQSRFSLRLQRKWMLIEARKCVHCGLIYRWPTDPADGARTFYEQAYAGQQATDIPDRETLDRLVAANFAASQYDKSDRVHFLQQTLGSANRRRLLDFGSSWGYSLFQYNAAGWQAFGFDLDRHRALFGREQLEVDIRSNLDEYGHDRFDVILADHSLEHVPRPGETLASWSRLAARGASLIVFVPNGSCTAARRLGVGWGPLIGEAHTVAFTMDWLARNLPQHGWQPYFCSPDGTKLADRQYLTDHGEICVVAQLHDSSVV